MSRKGDILVLKMKKMPRYCHNVSLKRGHVFSQRRTCYEIHAGLVKCLWKHCFVQIVAKWSCFLIWPLWEFVKMKVM